MDKGVAFLLCVLYVALSQVPITNAEWRGNVCNKTKTEYSKESYCVRYIWFACIGSKTKMTSRVSNYKSCCPEWNHNGDQNCNIPICSPECQKGATCVAPSKCERTIDQADKNMGFAIGGPDNITFMPDKAIIHEFGALNITCLANCNISCSFQWIKHGNSDNEETMVENLATMQLSNATRRDAGNYSCRATNRVTNITVVDSITLEVICNNDLGRNCSTDMTEKNPPLSGVYQDEARIQNVIKALAGTSLILACLICGFFVYETRKRCYKPNSHFSTAAEVGLPDTMEFNTYSDPCTDNWTIGNDSAGDHNTRVDNTGAHVYDQTLASKQNLVYEDPQ